MADVSACPGALPGVWYCGYGNVDRCKGPNQDTFGLAPGYFADFRNSTKFTTAVISATATPAAPTSSTATNSTSTGTCNPTCSSVTAVHTGIEAGVGIPLFLCMLASFLFYFRERRLRRKLNIAYEEALKHPPVSESEREYQKSLAQMQEADATLQQAVFEAPQTPAHIPELRS
ncbi:hypothetical protein MMC07_008408 [Pseudocyphellaria aurata]|nr:hypothetical protein [Pseudocyphellaria aurata]